MSPVRLGDWKGVRLDVSKNPDGPIELYNLKDDLGETRNVAARRPEIVAKIDEYMKDAHVPSEHWPMPGEEAGVVVRAVR